MTETQRKAIYAAASAILTALGALGVIDGAQTDQLLSIASGALTIAMAVVPLIAHHHTVTTPPAAIVDETTTTEQARPQAADPAPAIIDDYRPQHADA
ncbi:phage holin [Acidipropionibacterium timonense]|uniref:phage holin n=1 Tax=Acidipropionibacterium timonense TaxID=2161818 RepID=UPI00102FE3F8|nr:hypothetical protein [Acidipropionibacterium timonense]